MSYLLNTVDLSTYGIVAGHCPSSNIALSGQYSMPERIGECFHDWGDSDGVEPWVLVDEIFFAGRDILFTGSIIGTNSVINTYLQSLYSTINAFTGNVVLSTPYGDFTGYVKSVIPVHLNGGASLVMTFREPIVTLTGTVKSTGASSYTIDSIPFSSFGLYLSNSKELHDLPELKEQEYTKYGSEGWQVVKRKNKDLVLNGFIYATSLALFEADIKSLYAKFASEGTRSIKINDTVMVVCFATKGFSVDNILLFDSGTIANFSMNLVITSVTYS